MLGDLRVRTSGEPQRQGYIVECGEMVEQAEILEDDPDPPLQCADLGALEPSDLAAEQMKPTA